MMLGNVMAVTFRQMQAATDSKCRRTGFCMNLYIKCDFIQDAYWMHKRAARSLVDLVFGLQCVQISWDPPELQVYQLGPKQFHIR